MKNKQIEKIFFGEDKNLKNKYITYLSYLHIVNSLSKRDSITNNICSDNGINYIKKIKKLYSEMDSPLCFLNDKTYNLYLYTMPHILKIMNNPSQSIIKEKRLIQKSKLKVIDSSTFRWLATKPGTTFKEKLANQEKVLSTVKKYSYNTKENQVFVSYVSKLKDYFADKIEMIKEFPELFGNKEKYDNAFIETNKYINKLNSFLREEFEAVQKKEHSTPNNILIGNVHYSSIWKSNQDLRKDDFETFKINDFYKVIVKCFELSLMASTEYDFVDKNCDINNIESNYLFYKINNHHIDEINFDYDGNFIINMNKYNYNDSKYELDEDKSLSHVLEFEVINSKNDNLHGLACKAILDSEYEFQFTANLYGIKSTINWLASMLKLTINFEKSYSNKQLNFNIASLNAYNNIIGNENEYFNPHILYDGNDSFEIRNSLYFVNGINVYLDTYNDLNKYNELLQSCKPYYKRDAESLLIYDIKDSFDEFSSKNLRNTFSINFPGSYPVWRSILSAESISKGYTDMVIDFTGKEVYATILGRKKDLYVHKGLISWPLNLTKYSEKDFLKDYLDIYAEEFDLSFSEEVINDCLVSGSLSYLLNKKSGFLMLLEGDENNHEYIRIDYSQEIYEECLNELIKTIDDINVEFNGKELLIVLPDFIDTKIFDKTINNNQLIIGARKIAERVKKHQVAWYECLPDLSLEIIKNGYYDTIKLVENRECENIIGKTDSWVINETFILKKGLSDYSLPLIKSFLGEQNKTINASIKDPSFPLKEDVEVNLKLSYSYGSENSYILTFIPINSDNSPFKKIIVDWKEEIADRDLIYPKIDDCLYSAQDIDKKLNEIIPKRISTIERNISFLKSGKEIFIDKNGISHDNFKEATKNITFIANEKQRFRAFSISAASDLEKCIKNYNIISIVEELIIYSEKFKHTDKEKFLKRRLALENSLVSLSMNKELFLNNKLVFGFGCYGRYLNGNPIDVDIINIAYDDLISITKEPNYQYGKNIRLFLEQFTSTITCDCKAFYKMAKVSPAFLNYLLNIIIDVLDKMSDYDWNTPIYKEEAYGNNASENGYLVRHCLELLVSFLYCREMTFFSDLRPGNNKALHIINSLKKINRDFQNAHFDPSVKKEKFMKTKYAMQLEIPNELNKMWDVAYCLILYLSGDKRANNIVIRSNE